MFQLQIQMDEDRFIHLIIMYIYIYINIQYTVIRRIHCVFTIIRKMERLNMGPIMKCEDIMFTMS